MRNRLANFLEYLADLIRPTPPPRPTSLFRERLIDRYRNERDPDTFLSEFFQPEKKEKSE